ncbi:hypothetical protein GALL_494770 [mine drainage metagenome]|uniref:Uncharacterized protein n=1 Tax=mine drainage metagenome TaxID=410659 RepID=A0A1J5PZ56_9ZZZZ
MPAPDRGNPVNGWQLRVGVLRHIHHREVVGVERIRQTQEGKTGQHPQRLRSRTGQGHPVSAVALSTGNTQDTQGQCHQQGKNQGKMAKFWNHGVCRSVRWEFKSLLQGFGGFVDLRLVHGGLRLRRHVVFVVFGQHLRGSELT